MRPCEQGVLATQLNFGHFEMWTDLQLPKIIGEESGDLWGELTMLVAILLQEGAHGQEVEEPAQATS